MTWVKSYFSLVKFSHTIFAMPFAMVGFLFAIGLRNYDFRWTTFLLIILCMVFARSAAMAFNRWADRKIDEKNPRTSFREIPKGIIKANEALWFVIVNGILFMAATFFINPLCFYLSPLALTVVLGYSYTKRFTFLCHLFLGLGLALAPIGAYIAVTGKFAFLPLLISFAVLTWTGGFDIIYALQDDDFDKNSDLFSIPAHFGRKKALLISIVLHLMTLFFIYFAGIYAGFGLFYWIGSGIFTVLMIYQHIIVKPSDISKVNIAFGTMNGIASVIFAIFVLLELFVKI